MPRQIACKILIVMAGILSMASAAYGNDDWAIYPPTERGDSSRDPGVRGKVRSIPYYPGYCRPHYGPLRFFVRGAFGCAGLDLELEAIAGGAGSSDYGIYTGGPRYDEPILLHLGGNGPYRGTPDIIDAFGRGH